MLAKAAMLYHTTLAKLQPNCSTSLVATPIPCSSPCCWFYNKSVLDVATRDPHHVLAPFYLSRLNYNLGGQWGGVGLGGGCRKSRFMTRHQAN